MKTDELKMAKFLLKKVDRSLVSWSGDSFSNNATPTVKIAKQMI